jgi:hypothetical protein
MRNSLLHELFARQVVAGGDVDRSLRIAIERTADVLADRVISGDTPGSALRRIGIRDPDEVERLLLHEVSQYSVLAHTVPLHRLSPQAVLAGVRELLRPGKISDVPTARCLAQHLPTTRPPTQQEVADAWRRCTG